MISDLELTISASVIIDGRKEWITAKVDYVPGICTIEDANAFAALTMAVDQVESPDAEAINIILKSDKTHKQLLAKLSRILSDKLRNKCRTATTQT